MAAGMGLGVVKAMVAPPVVWPAPDYATAAASVRDLFASLGLDPANPLGRWIQPGMTVVVKPNWVKLRRASPPLGLDFARFQHQTWPAELKKDCTRALVAFLEVRQQWAEIDDASSYVRWVHPLEGDPRRLEIHIAHELAAYLKTA
jgi:hypothetical protein